MLTEGPHSNAPEIWLALWQGVLLIGPMVHIVKKNGRNVGLHCGIWGVDCTPGQAYNVSVIMALRALGMGPNCPKTPPIAPYQGTMACASMVLHVRRQAEPYFQENSGRFFEA